MGIDYHGAIALKHFTSKNKFGNTLTIGRQAIHVSPKVIKKIFRLNKASIDRVFTSAQKKSNFYFCEKLLTELGARSVDSLDASDYEGANIILDLNRELKSEKKYNTIIDFGSSEHIYNVAQAFENYSQLLAEGGTLIHVLPANNQCGHGFYQFSPEFFYSLYNNKNGYRDTEIFMVEIPNKKFWFKVNTPKKGQRIFFDSKKPCYVVCFTKKNINFPSEKNIQQSDYLYEWGLEPQANPYVINESKLKSKIRKIPIFFLLIKLIIHFPRFWLVSVRNRFSSMKGKKSMKVLIKEII